LSIALKRQWLQSLYPESTSKLLFLQFRAKKLMRIWSIHPCYLDARGLVALWREGLLAQKVLLGDTRGYRNHPQLLRFRRTINPVGAIACYLLGVAEEADARGYNFDRGRIVQRRIRSRLTVTDGQLQYEFDHLLAKLRQRAPGLHTELYNIKRVKTHPLFDTIRGAVEEWEVL